MKLSSKSLYAVRALFSMAYHARNRPSKVDEISAREDIRPRFLEQIFQDLKKAGIVGSKRGPKGGYFLLEDPRSITLGQIVRAIEGESSISLCRETPEQAPKVAGSLCVTGSVWKEIATELDSVLDSVTLEDMIHRGEKLGVHREGYNEFIYII